jgi:hypothetical protein
MISRIIQTSVDVIRLSFASADNIDLGLNNSWYHAQPHPIIAYKVTQSSEKAPFTSEIAGSLDLSPFEWNFDL